MDTAIDSPNSNDPESQKSLDEQSKARFAFLKETIKGVFDSRFGEFFRSPVDPERDNVADYFDVIKNPMDLGTILEKIENGDYSDPDDVIADFRLMISNCFSYNPSTSLIYSHCKEAEKFFNRKMAKYSNNSVLPNKRRNSCSSPKKSDEPKKESKSKPSKIKKTSSTPTVDKSNSGDFTPVRESTRVAKKVNKDLPETERTYNQSPGLNYCLSVITELLQKKHYDYAFPFYYPVDPVALNIPDYHEVVKYPMDLNTIKAKLKSGSYSHPQHFVRDVRLIFTNCYRYNGVTSDISASAVKLQNVFEMLIASCPKEFFFNIFVAGIDIPDEVPVFSRSMRRTTGVETRPIMDYLQNIDRKLQLLSDDVSKIKTDKSSAKAHENYLPPSKRANANKVPAIPHFHKKRHLPVHPGHKIRHPEKADDVEPMTCDEKINLHSQISIMPESKLKEILAIIDQREPWAKKTHDKNSSVEFDLEALSVTTLRALEKYVQLQNRKRITDHSLRRKYNHEENMSRKEELALKLKDVVSKISGRTPIVSEIHNNGSRTKTKKNKEERTERLSDSSSSSEEDEFLKQFNVPRNPTSLLSQSSNASAGNPSATPTSNGTRGHPTSKPGVTVSGKNINSILAQATKYKTLLGDEFTTDNSHVSFLEKLGLTPGPGATNSLNSLRTNSHKGASNLAQAGQPESTSSKANTNNSISSQQNTTKLDVSSKN